MLNSSAHGSYYSAEFIFPDFFSNYTRQDESFSLTNMFTQNTNVCFQLFAITLETGAAEQI